MLKDKEDNFLGDQITNNIKYADNEWQALGTTDRTSMYLSEPILDLIFEIRFMIETLVNINIYQGLQLKVKSIQQLPCRMI